MPSAFDFISSDNNWLEDIITPHEDQHSDNVFLYDFFRGNSLIYTYKTGGNSTITSEGRGELLVDPSEEKTHKAQEFRCRLYLKNHFEANAATILQSVQERFQNRSPIPMTTEAF